MIRNATTTDIPAITAMYDAVHTREEAGCSTVGWVRGVYPTRQTAADGVTRGDMFVLQEGDTVVASAVINRTQVAEYTDCPWQYAATPEQVMVLHTLVVDPAHSGKGHAKAFVAFYEAYAKQQGCTVLRMDTQAKNTTARRLYAKLGYREAGIVLSQFNGIPDVQLVCLEKALV